MTEWLKSRTVALSKKEVYKCILDMALGIRQVHDCGFVHMDVKPDNFLVKADNTIKLCDFGLTVDLNQKKDDSDLKEHEKIKAKDVSEGDASYMAPELLSFNAKVTAKVDIFSFGISIIECFNNDGIKKLPKNGELWTRVREEDPSFFISFPYKDLANLIDNMTGKDVEKRYSIEDILRNKYIQKLMNEDYSTPAKEKVF